MSSYNSVNLIGHLGRDAEIKNFSTGNSLISFSLATTEYWRNKEGKKQERTDWHRIEVNGDFAKRILQYLTKGKMVLVEGSIRTEEWEKDGEKKRATKIRARKIVLLSPSGKMGARVEVEPEPEQETELAHAGVSDDDDVPF